MLHLQLSKDILVTLLHAGRVWDMRTGRSIMALQGHVQGILAMDFSRDGYHLATGSEDHSCRIWDLRKRGCVYVLPAHKSLIAQVQLHLHIGCTALAVVTVHFGVQCMAFDVILLLSYPASMSVSFSVPESLMPDSQMLA